MNRRAFFSGLFAILPAATSYKRIWKELAKTEMPQEAMIATVACRDSVWTWSINIDGATVEVRELKGILVTECPYIIQYKIETLEFASEQRGT